MNWNLTTLAVVAMAAMLTGCSLPKESQVGEVRPHNGDEQIAWSIDQVDATRDMVTGDLMYVFCKRNECTVSQKSVTVEAPRRAVAQGGNAVVKVPQQKTHAISIPFDYDRSKINKSGLKVLAENADLLSRAKKIAVVGLADSVNRDAYNLKLATKRAEAVKEWLKKHLEKSGKAVEIDASARLVKVSESGEYPPGETFKGRRVDMNVLIVEVK